MCVGIFALIYWKTGDPPAFKEQWLSLLTFTLNFRNTQEIPGLGHLWSLSVEEQFYLLWPFLIFWMPVPLLRRVLLVLIGCGPLIRLLAGLYYTRTASDTSHVGLAVYTFSPSHFDAFAAGATLTILPESWRILWQKKSGVVLRTVLGATVLAGVAQLLALHTHDRWTLLSVGYPIHTPELRQYIWTYTLLNASSAALIFHLLTHASTVQTTLGKIFNNPFLVYTGRISYGMYVWHVLVLEIFLRVWPDWAFHRLSPRGFLLEALYFAAVIALASASFWTLERFFLRFKDAVGSRRETVLAGAES